MEIASVWKEEVNLALIKYTKSVIQMIRNGKLYDLPVQIRQPDESVKLERYPCITWYNLMDLPNVYRTDNMPTNYYDNTTHRVTTYYPPEPFDMYYQMDFWGKLWGDVDEMTKLWLQALPAFSRGKFFNLPVVDSCNKEQSILCVQKDVLRRRDSMTDGQKLIHSTITYAIEGYVGRDYSKTYPSVKDINVEREG